MGRITYKNQCTKCTSLIDITTARTDTSSYATSSQSNSHNDAIKSTINTDHITEVYVSYDSEEYLENEVITYIGGYVLSKLLKTDLNCQLCRSKLSSDEPGLFIKNGILFFGRTSIWSTVSIDRWK